MKLSALLEAAGAHRLAGPADLEIAGLAHDSRAVKPGWLFFALPGTKTDGNRHVKAARDAGAVAVVSELEPPPPPIAPGLSWARVEDAALAMGRMADAFFGRPSSALKVIGVTGTNGKTTTTYFLESIIKAGGGVPGVAGTVDYRLDGAVVSKAPNTTPISLELQRLLAHFRDHGATHAAMEVSSHALTLKRVDEVDFDAAVFTNLSRDHLDFHRTLDEYFEAKARLFELLDKASTTKERRVAALNHDDPRSEILRRRLAEAEPVLFGLGVGADLRAADLQPTQEGTFFQLVWRGKRRPAHVRLVGEHNVANALGAAAAMLGLGQDEETVIAGLEALKRVPGRLEPVQAGQPFSVFVDYAHTDAALATVLGYLGKLPHERIITVFGCGGDRDRGKRAPMGAAACEGSDLVFVTSDNPRTEDPEAILADIELGIRGRKNYKIVPDRAAAIGEAVAAAKPGDIVLIAGKGHEDYQILGDKTVHFDDREVAAAEIKKRA